MRFLALILLAACGPTGSDTSTTTPVGSGPTTTGAGGSTPAAPVRVVSWNVQNLGAVDSQEYTAVHDILARIDADVVGLYELDAGENPALQTLAADLGYDTVIVPGSNPFGDLHNAMLSRLASTGTYHASDDLSGDSSANDVTRFPVSVTLDNGVSFVGMHCKSGFEDADEFRRTVDGIRMTQSGADPARTVIMGDINQEVDEGDSPATFTDFPYGMPGSYYLGNDLYTEMTGPGLANGPFPHFTAAGFKVVQAAQLDGSLGTRPTSGRRIDYQLTGSGLADAVIAAEIYDARQDDGSGIATAGTAPERRASEYASDHLPVVVDYQLD